MELTTQQWVAFKLGGTHVAVPGTDVAFVVPIADYTSHASHDSAVLHYAGREFPVYQLNKHLNIATNTSEGRFCICLGSAQQTPYILIVESLVQVTLDQHDVVGELPSVMRQAQHTCPVFAVAQSADTFLLLCSAASLAETIQQQLPEAEVQVEA